MATPPRRPEPPRKPETARKPATQPPPTSTGRKPATQPPPTSSQRKASGAPAKAPTSRQSPSTGRAAASAPEKDNKKLIIIGSCVGGGILLIIVIALAMGGGDKGGAGETKKKEQKTEDKGPSREVLDREATGKQKCEEAKRKFNTALSAPKSASLWGEETRYSDLQEAVRIFEEGLALYKQAGRSTSEEKTFETERRELIDKATRQIESEARSLCDAAKSGIQSKLPGLSGASGDRKDQLLKDLAESLKKLKSGMDLFKTAAGISGKMADVQAYKSVRDDGLKVILPDLESEAAAACDEGMKLFEKIRDNLSKDLEGAAKEQFKKDINQVYNCLDRGTKLYSKAAEISDKDYKLEQINQAKKLASSKVKELGHE